jgi:hypothetical protein
MHHFTHQVHKYIGSDHENTYQDCVSGQLGSCNRKSLLEAFNIRHSGLDPESRISFWIPAFAGMTTLIYANIYATFRFRFGEASRQTTCALRLAPCDI